MSWVCLISIGITYVLKQKGVAFWWDWSFLFKMEQNQTTSSKFRCVFCSLLNYTIFHNASYSLTSSCLSAYFLDIVMIGICPPQVTVAQSAIGSAKPDPGGALERAVQSGTDRIVPHLVSFLGHCVQSRAAFQSSSVKALKIQWT